MIAQRNVFYKGEFIYLVAEKEKKHPIVKVL